MMKMLDTREELIKGLLSTDKLYILIDEHIHKITLVNIIKFGNIAESSIMASYVKLKEYNTNITIGEISIPKRMTLYSIPHSQNTVLSLGFGRFLMEYQNIYETKKLIKSIAIYGLGYKIDQIFVIDKPFNKNGAERYRRLIKQLQKVYKRINYNIL